jgi:hypothetical protein
MYGQYHEVPYKSNVQEAIIGPFSWSQLLWLTPGVIGSYKLATTIPKLPINSFIFARIHWIIPIIISLIFAFFKDPKTNLSLFELLVTKIKLRNRNRVFHYRRKNMPSAKEVETR